MNPMELVIIAAGLAMDAFAAAVCKGLAAEKAGVRRCLLTGLYFGSFQALMPLIGFALGAGMPNGITAVDHWIAFILLSVIGFRMLLDARRGDDAPDASFAPRVMLPLAVATSIDALAVGAGFAFLQIRIFPAVGLIGGITFLLSALGVRLSSRFGSRFRGPAQLAGGLTLLLMGAKILIEHLIDS